MAGQTRINYILNWLLFIDGTLIMVSGIMISQVALPTLGITLASGFAWRGLHDTAANIGLVLLGLHTALHWAWVVNTFDKYLVWPVIRLFSTKQKKDVSV
jgi:cytochrome b subunit of formate dehydrogenase